MNQQAKRLSVATELEADFSSNCPTGHDPEAMRRAAEWMDSDGGRDLSSARPLDIGVPAIRELRGELPE